MREGVGGTALLTAPALSHGFERCLRSGGALCPAGLLAIPVPEALIRPWPAECVWESNGQEMPPRLYRYALRHDTGGEVPPLPPEDALLHPVRAWSSGYEGDLLLHEM
jgi:hypothetical protein